MRLKNILCLMILMSTNFVVQSQSGIDSSHHVPVDKGLSERWKKALWSREKKIYRGAELKTIGMPCGGIASGQLYVRGDGTLAGWWIANNAYNTGYGKDSLMNFQTALGPWKVCYQTFEPISYIDQGFSIAIKQAGKTMVHNLDKRGFNEISFTGEYPIAKINYASTLVKLPVSVSMEVFSPFIPLDEKESATPGTVMKFRVTNTSSTAAEVSLTGWLQNLVCIDLEKKINATSHNTVIKNASITSVYMSLNKAANPQLQRHPYYGDISLSVLGSNGIGDADFNTAKDHHAVDTAERKLGDKLLGAATSAFTLKPGETKEITYLVTWYFPNRPSYYKGSDLTAILPNDWNEALPTTGATILGNMYANWFGSSTDVASWLQKNLDRLSGITHRFHDTYYNQTTLPYWLSQRLLMPVSTLATETCQWWASDKFWAWEGVGSCVGTCTHVWNYEQALAHLFPGLERNIREKTDFDVSFQKDGSILARDGWGDVLIDGHAGAILKAYREYLNSGNDLFLSRNWDRIKKAMEYLIGEDENNDGLIEKTQANTYDIAFYGANTYVGGLYLAALKAAAQMALLMHDPEFSKKCTAIFSAGEKNTVDKLWNGEYFRQDVDLVKHPRFQYGNGCLSDQLFGQTWSHLANLGYIYPAENVHTALQAIWKYNWAPDVGSQNNIHPPERIYANPGEAGLLVCTWPKGPHMGENGVRYRDEVWTGIEYQVATNMIYENMTDEGLSIVKGVHDRYSPEKHNPWNEIECGDHYARAMASWGVLLALENYYYNGPEKTIGFSPKIQADHFKGFFTSAEGWGNISQERIAGRQENKISVAYGTLSVKQVELETNRQPKKLVVKSGGREIPNTFSLNEGKLVVQFQALELGEGADLDVSIIL